MAELYSLRDAADLVGVKPYRLAYACGARLIPEPKLRIANHRMFTPKDIETAKKYFAEQPRPGRQKGGK